MDNEAMPRFEGQATPSLLETRGDQMITIDGLTWPLKVWFNFCPIPHDQLDPAKIEQAAQEFLKGKNPFAKKD